jgi:hypothetical protein
MIIQKYIKASVYTIIDIVHDVRQLLAIGDIPLGVNIGSEYKGRCYIVATWLSNNSHQFWIREILIQCRVHHLSYLQVENEPRTDN